MLKISKLSAKVANKEVIKNVDLTIKKGEIHVIMGPNGAGKSSLASVLMGNPEYTLLNGKIELMGQDITNFEVDERARKGLFMAFQYPMEIEGITTDEFIYNALQTKYSGARKLSDFSFDHQFEEAKAQLKMPDDLSQRHLNVGFSGGEKKRNEIFQLKMLKPHLAILDEVDSGLDIDALKVVGETIMDEIKNRNDDFSVLIITHYRRLLDYIKPDFIHIMKDGEIIGSGDITLVDELEANGFSDLSQSKISSLCGTLGRL